MVEELCIAVKKLWLMIPLSNMQFLIAFTYEILSDQIHS